MKTLTFEITRASNPLAESIVITTIEVGKAGSQEQVRVMFAPEKPH